MDEGKGGGGEREKDVGTRSTARFGRVDPEAGPCWPARSPPRSGIFWAGLREIRRILLAGIMPRCPTRGSITTLLGDSTAVSDSGRSSWGSLSEMGLASLNACRTSSSSRDVPDGLTLNTLMSTR